MELNIGQDTWLPEVIATCFISYKEKELIKTVKCILKEFNVKEDYYLTNLKDKSLDIDIIHIDLLEKFKDLCKC